MNAARSSVNGVILAGGRSRRMGADKALMRLGSETLLERSIRTLESIAAHIVIAGGEQDRYVIPGITCLGDAQADTGPLGGLLTAFEATDASTLLVLACDLPFVTAPLMQLLLDTAPDAPVVIARSGDIVQPLCGRYAASVRPSLKAYLATGNRKVMGFVSTCQHTYLDIDPGHALFHPSQLSNINLRDDLQRAESIMLQHGTSQ